MSGETGGTSLDGLREGGSRHLLALGVAVVVGLALAWVHWLGLFAAGALVGLVSRDLPRAVVAGLVVGVIVLVANQFVVPAMDPSEFLGLAPASYVTIAAAFVAPVWGSLVRAVV
ncbi:hypothetical protein SAMN04487949_2955 [Halogranum gelatinilyticum]|uniref:Uncharacterized protein n=1 Tax=Halogranum gelatinilyticum TaxID=660521 RepID=A0A1G9XE78_9EURY|nr:hypothetical protein [Halogranum gelatinilyticum]SDM95060.1 hypothetical protein SAMN04487949_2955 [Halogranum gelatinilyticum]